MQYNYRLFFIALLSFLSISSSLIAQDNSDDNQWSEYGLQYRTLQVSFIPGLSTNGIDATNYASKYSFNILVGYNGALDQGFEFGGLFNAHKYYATGGQIAGLANYSGEETTGIQLAGLGNYSGDDMLGIQFAGAANISAEDMQGLQFSGILNAAGGNSQGLQAAGIINAARHDMQGLFASGIGNIAGGDIQGLLASGILNVSRGDMQGIAVSGTLNYAKSFQGIAISQININKEFQGIQIGQLNVARQGQGIQVGLINYAKGFEGVPVGLISYYGDGRSNIDIWSSDGGFTNLGVKLGTDEVYNMVSIGYNPLLGGDVWQVGWSIGRRHQYKHHFLYSDFSFFKINEGDWTEDLNSNIKYRLLFGKEFADGVKLYGGPTLNMLISRVENSDRYTWYKLFDFGAKGRDYTFWAGFFVGIELF